MHRCPSLCLHTGAPLWVPWHSHCPSRNLTLPAVSICSRWSLSASPFGSSWRSYCTSCRHFAAMSCSACSSAGPAPYSSGYIVRHTGIQHQTKKHMLKPTLLPPPSQSQPPAQPSSLAPLGSFTQRSSKLTPASTSSDPSPHPNTTPTLPTTSLRSHQLTSQHRHLNPNRLLSLALARLRGPLLSDRASRHRNPPPPAHLHSQTASLHSCPPPRLHAATGPRLMGSGGRGLMWAPLGLSGFSVDI